MSKAELKQKPGESDAQYKKRIAMYAAEVPKQARGESDLEFSNRLNTEYEKVMAKVAQLPSGGVITDGKGPAAEEGARWDRSSTARTPSADPKEYERVAYRDALATVLLLNPPGTDVDAVRGRIVALDELAAMKQIQSAPKFGRPGSSWRS